MSREKCARLPFQESRQGRSSGVYETVPSFAASGGAPGIAADFVYQAEGDCFQCPAGQTLHRASSGEEGKKVYRGQDEICAGCPYHTRCCHSKEGKARSISSDDKEPLRQAMMEKMGREDAKETYKDRKQIVEPVFGQIKNSGFRRFSVRGFQAARGEFSLVCAVHNFKKIVRALVRGVVRPETWKRAVAAA